MTIKIQNFIDSPDRDWQESKDLRVMSRDFYEGHATVKSKAKVEKYLFRSPNEKKEDYDDRKARAAFDPFVETIIQARQSLLFRREHTRELKGLGDDELIENVDLIGTSADVFFERVAAEAQIDGIHWVLINRRGLHPIQDENGESKPQKVSKRQERDLNLRPFFQPIMGESVIRTKLAEDGELDWAVIRTERDEEPQTDKPWEEPEGTVEQWHVWTRNEWFVYERQAVQGKNAREKNPDASITLIQSGRHDLGVVPLVPWFGIRKDQRRLIGLPVAKNVLSHILLMYNQESDKDHYLRISGHPIPYHWGPKKIDKLDARAGFFLQSVANHGQPGANYLETNGSAYDTIQRAIDKNFWKIFLFTLKQARQDTKQVQAADSQREDRRIFSSSLMSVSRLYEESEKRCWQIWGKWQRKESQNIEIEYSRDFDDKQITEQMVRAFSEMRSRKQIPLKVLFEQLQEGELISNEMTFEEFKAELEQDAAMDSEMGLGFDRADAAASLDEESDGGGTDDQS